MSAPRRAAASRPGSRTAVTRTAVTRTAVTTTALTRPALTRTAPARAAACPCAAQSSASARSWTACSWAAMASRSRQCAQMPAEPTGALLHRGPTRHSAARASDNDGDDGARRSDDAVKNDASRDGENDCALVRAGRGRSVRVREHRHACDSPSQSLLIYSPSPARCVLMKSGRGRARPCAEKGDLRITELCPGPAQFVPPGEVLQNGEVHDPIRTGGSRSGDVTGIDRLGILQFIVVHDLRLGLAGQALLAFALARDIVFGGAAIIPAGANFPGGERIGGHGLSPAWAFRPERRPRKRGSGILHFAHSGYAAPAWKGANSAAPAS